MQREPGMLQSYGLRMFSFLSDLLRWFGQGLRPRRSADRRFPGDAPTVGDTLGEGLLDPPFG